MFTHGTINAELNELIEITDEDYNKFKKELVGKNKTLVEKKKDDDFQKAFKELWPNTYNRINNDKTSAKAVLNELEKQKNLYNTILRHDLEKFSASNLTNDHTRQLVCRDCNEKCYLKYIPCSSACLTGCQLINKCRCSSACCTNSSATSNICTACSRAHDCRLKELNQASSLFLKRDETKDTNIKCLNYPNYVSGYDLPYISLKDKEHLVKYSYNKETLTEDVKLLQNIKDNNEKLRAKCKIEKTNDLVDDIISKVNVLQTELKKKTAEIKVKEDLLKLKENYIRIQNENKHILTRKDRSRSKSPVCTRHRSSSAKRAKTPDNRDSSLHHHHHYYNRKVHTPTSSINSILTYDPAESKKNKYWKSWRDVPARVDSWNYDYDFNIY